MCSVYFYKGHFDYVCYFLFLFVSCVLFGLVSLSVPVQVIDWKDSSPK